MKETIIKGIKLIAIIALCYGLSWLITCGIVKLITLCFEWTFKWSSATGIWLILCLLKTKFNVKVED